MQEVAIFTHVAEGTIYTGGAFIEVTLTSLVVYFKNKLLLEATSPKVGSQISHIGGALQESQFGIVAHCEFPRLNWIIKINDVESRNEQLIKDSFLLLRGMLFFYILEV